MWFVGIDWSQRHHDCVVLDRDGRRVGRIRVAHSAEGIAQLCAWLREQARLAGETAPEAPADPEHLLCVLETNHGLLITALLDAGFPVYPVNPKTVDQAHGAAGAKTDEIDAHLLAKHGFANRWELRRLAPDRQPAGGRAQSPDARPGPARARADASGQSPHRRPQGLLSRGARALRPPAPALGAGVPGALPDARPGAVRYASERSERPAYMGSHTSRSPSERSSACGACSSPPSSSPSRSRRAPRPASC
jgi:transposase